MAVKGNHEIIYYIWETHWKFWGRVSQFSLLLSQRKMTRLICMAISYVNGILLTLSFIPTPILILLCFKPVSEQLGKLPIWLYSCCHCKQEPTAADHTSLCQNCYSLITHCDCIRCITLQRNFTLIICQIIILYTCKYIYNIIWSYRVKCHT